MKIIPSIDIMGGKCVRLRQGKFEEVTTYVVDPLTVAKQYASDGAEVLHIVDLDGARSGDITENVLLAQMAKETGLKLQVGGGIRDKISVKRCLALGVSRAVIGSLAVRDRKKTAEIMRETGAEKIVLALDVNVRADGTPEAAIHGWTEGGGESLWELLDFYSGVGLKHLLCTDISRDGTLEGPSLKLYAEINKKFPDLQLQASGGVGTLEDLKLLKKGGAQSVIVGKALFEKRFTLKEAMEC